ncbi:MAG TPA: hypothetical protein VFO38_00170 [Candidatus Saccharimonadales bacterium]|nr:hypothetical protein [Candidatus Saccharimonadales bacterium]
MSTSSRGPIKLRLVAAATALVLAACGTTPQPSGDAQEVKSTSYCAVADADGNGYTIVDDDMCDDDGDGHGGGGWFIFMDGHHSHGRGTHLTKSQIKGSPIKWNDSTARQSAGLAPKGKVATGQRTDSGAGLGKGATSKGTSGTGNSGTSSGG